MSEAKLIVTNDFAQTNILIELKDGSQIEFNVHKGELIKALQSNNDQTVISVIQNQP